MRWARGALFGFLALNIVLSVLNWRLIVQEHALIDRAKELRMRNEQVADELRKATAALPPHACRDIILPGEECYQRFELHIPGRSPEAAPL